MSQSSLICPSPRIPISTTQTSVSFVMERSVKDNPISLLKFFCVEHTLNLEERILLIISFVVVFPLEPVIAITGILNFFR